MDDNANARAFKRTQNKPEQEMVEFDPQDPATEMVLDRQNEVTYENHDEEFPERERSGNDKTTIWSGFQSGAVPEDTSLTIEDAMEGIVSQGYQGGSGGTGGPMTGETTPGGMSEDLTQGPAGGGRYGGPTGGDVNGAGRNPDSFPYDGKGEEIRIGSREETERALEHRIAEQNTAELLRENRP